MCTATAKGLAHAAHKHLTAVEHNLARAACRVHSCTGQRHTRTHVPQLEGRTLPSEPASPAAVAFRGRLGTVTTLPSHAAPPCCCLAVAAALEHQGTASTYACTRACHGHVRRALHTRPDPAARLTLGFACRGALVAVAALRVATAMPSATGTPRASRLRTPAHRTWPQGHALRSPSFIAGPRPCRTPHAHELTTLAVSHALGLAHCRTVAPRSLLPCLARFSA